MLHVVCRFQYVCDELECFSREQPGGSPVKHLAELCVSLLLFQPVNNRPAARPSRCASVFADRLPLICCVGATNDPLHAVGEEV